MKILSFLIRLVLLGAVFSMETRGDAWSENKRNLIDGISSEPTLEEIIFLCSISGINSTKKERSDVAAHAFERLQSIPDFSDKVIGYLHSEKTRWKAGAPPEEYDQRRAEILGALGRIRDPRVVIILGEFLKDMDWTSDPVEHLKSGRDYSLVVPNGLLAAMSLGNLISDSPLTKNPNQYLEEDVNSWNRWYEEIKLGKKTFSFKDGDGRYLLKGDGSWGIEPTVMRKDYKSKTRKIPENAVPYGWAKTRTNFFEKISDYWWLVVPGGAIVLLACRVFLRVNRRHMRNRKD